MVLVRAIVIDDDPFVRSSLTAGLAHYGIKVVRSFENGAETEQTMNNEKIDVVIVDLDLGPGPSGIDICTAMRTNHSGIGLVLLTSYQDPRIFDPGAPSLPKGTKFISKSELSDFRLLVDAVFAAKTKPLVPMKRGENPNNPLTANQLEVLKMVAQGLSSQEIAHNKGVSVKAIEGTISKIQAAVGINKSKSMNQRVQLARIYYMMSGKKPPGA